MRLMFVNETEKRFVNALSGRAKIGVVVKAGHDKLAQLARRAFIPGDERTDKPYLPVECCDLLD
jgi:hypothetical protein